jgi:cytochrome b
MQKEEFVRVWDPFVRIFHWAVVACVTTSVVTAEDFRWLHVRVGYVIFGLVLSRILWGFVGPTHARFRDFVYPPAKVIGYLKEMAARKPPHYLGHNPAGGAMVVALLVFLFLTPLAGMMAYGEKGHGPFADAPAMVSPAHADSGEAGDRQDHGGDSLWGEIHGALAGTLLFLIAVHFCGVLASSYLDHENLTLSMITGRKPTH